VDSTYDHIYETVAARRDAIAMARDAASRGDSLAGMLSELERLAEPFYLGIDEDPDDSDLGCFL